MAFNDRLIYLSGYLNETTSRYCISSNFISNQNE